MVCTLQRKHDERYESLRKKVLARISFLEQTSAGLEEKPAEGLRAAELWLAARSLKERLRVAEEKRVVRYESYEWVQGPLTVLECIMMVVQCIAMMVDPQTVKDANNLEFLQLIKESKAATKIWKPGEDPDSDDDGLNPQIGHFALRGQSASIVLPTTIDFKRHMVILMKLMIVFQVIHICTEDAQHGQSTTVEPSVLDVYTDGNKANVDSHYREIQEQVLRDHGSGTRSG